MSSLKVARQPGGGGGGEGEGQRSLNLPPPYLLLLVPVQFCWAPCLFVLFQLQDVRQCCKIILISPGSQRFGNSASCPLFSPLPHTSCPYFPSRVPPLVSLHLVPTLIYLGTSTKVLPSNKNPARF